MKVHSKLVVLAVSLLVALSAFAGNMHKGSLQTFDAVQVNGKSLPPGEYKLTWEGTGPNVQLNILKNNKVVATSEAHVVQLAQKPGNDTAVIGGNASGTRSLQEIRFAGKNFGLALGHADQAQMKGGDASR
jgi:hypothetical protein